MFRNKKFSGIDFHENYITCATIKLERGIPVVQGVTKIDFKSPILAGGRVNQPEDLSEFLEGVLKDGSISKEAHLAIPTQNILIRKITSLPDIGETELAKLLQFEIGESIHLPFENPIYDFVKIGSIVPEPIDGDREDGMEELSLDDLAQGIQQTMEGPKSEILLFATSQALSQDLADVCHEAGLKPLTAEIRGLALQRLLSYAQPRWLTQTEMIIDVSKNSLDIHIFKDGMIVFSRMMSIHTNDMVSNVSPTRPSPDDDVLLFEEDIPVFRETQSQIAATIEEVMDLNQESYVNEIALEIEKAQNFFRYSLNERDSEFKRIIVTGEKTDGIFQPLKERLGTEEIVRIDYRSILNHDFTNEDLLDSCSVAIGLAMRANDIQKK
ncbi:type IV pilus biogenesis protein PilM [Niallia sp. Krafla_26]|uniref:type IV pilus biogenesis protein PilM n=1 Tax=Niallia sp. Krafla_26 TaxID=3064703 RepID=UPI003D16BADD